jgi:hypothetical protein
LWQQSSLAFFDHRQTLSAPKLLSHIDLAGQRSMILVPYIGLHGFDAASTEFFRRKSLKKFGSLPAKQLVRI